MVIYRRHLEEEEREDAPNSWTSMRRDYEDQVSPSGD
jgi:hypothetical protein